MDFLMLDFDTWPLSIGEFNLVLGELAVVYGTFILVMILGLCILKSSCYL